MAAYGPWTGCSVDRQVANVSVHLAHPCTRKPCRLSLSCRVVVFLAGAPRYDKQMSSVPLHAPPAQGALSQHPALLREGTRACCMSMSPSAEYSSSVRVRGAVSQPTLRPECFCLREDNCCDRPTAEDRIDQAGSNCHQISRAAPKAESFMHASTKKLNCKEKTCTGEP